MVEIYSMDQATQQFPPRSQTKVAIIGAYKAKRNLPTAKGIPSLISIAVLDITIVQTMIGGKFSKETIQLQRTKNIRLTKDLYG